MAVCGVIFTASDKKLRVVAKSADLRTLDDIYGCATVTDCSLDTANF
jgi:hypothetical protein